MQETPGSHDFRSMSEIAEEARRELRKMVGRIFVDDEFIVIKIDPDDGSDKYEIPLFECDNCAKSIRWQFHLSEKK